MSISVEKLSFSYCTRNVLHDVSFSVDAGHMLAVLGANGVGKTTLFRCILGMEKHYDGKILIDGMDAKKLGARELAHKVAYIPQIHTQTFAYSVFDMVLMGTSHQVSTVSAPGARERETAQAALERVGIASLAKKNYNHLSGGEQQLVLIARALAQQSKIILMDEPTASLDYGNQALVLSQARSLADDGYTVILTTHNPQHAFWYADTALALYDGTVESLGTPKDVINAPLIKKIYRIDVAIVETESSILISPIMERRRV